MIPSKKYIIHRLNSAIRELAKQKQISQDYEWGQWINNYGLDNTLNNIKDLKQLIEREVT